MARSPEIPAESLILLSVQGVDVSDQLPDLGEGGRKLDISGETVLLVVSRGAIPDLVALPALETIVVWGDEEIRQGLDVFLRQDMLARISDPELRDTPMAVIASFSDDIQ